mgnify:CR=1 FL=1
MIAPSKGMSELSGFERSAPIGQDLGKNWADISADKVPSAAAGLFFLVG